MCKKLTSLLLTFIMLISMVNITAMAEEVQPASVYSEENYRIIKSEFPWSDWTNWPEQVPIRYGFESGYAEDGESYALHITGGNMGVKPDAGALYTMPAEFDLTDAQVIRLRYKSTASIDMYFNRAYQVNAGDVIPETEIETVKGVLGDDYSTYFNDDGKNISGRMWKKETKSSAVTLPSTNGEWQTKEIPISDFGSEAFLKTMRTAIVGTSLAPAYQVVFTNYQYGDDSTKYVTIDSITGLCAKAQEEESEPVNKTRQLMTKGNQFVYADDPTTAVRLTGVNVPGAEWTGTPQVEKIDRSVAYAIDNWHANLIRLPISQKGWYGDYNYVSDNGAAYRKYIDGIVGIASERNAYVLLSLSEYNTKLNEGHINFWKDVAERYKDNPAVLFSILSKSTYNSWSEWYGGLQEVNVQTGAITRVFYGYQQVVDAIRGIGAKNIIVATGINSATNLTGITQGFALSNGAGYGIAYDAHAYNDFSSTKIWDEYIGEARDTYPVIVGECGWDNHSTTPGYQPAVIEEWVEHFLTWLDDDITYKNKLSYVACNFYPSSSPYSYALVKDDGNWSSDDYAYEPTEDWGVYIKEHLEKCAGKSQPDDDKQQEPVNTPRQLMTLGNQFVYADDPTTAVRLTGVNVPGAEWTGTPQVEKIDRSVAYAIDNWDCNIIRLPVSTKGWYGNYNYVYDGGKAYREYIDSVIQIASEKGAYVLLDLNESKGFSDTQITFWEEVAVKYKNNPTVIFGLLGMADPLDWEEWYNGCVIEKAFGESTTLYGHQYVVDAIRSLGARNIIVVSGLSYASDISGITEGYALQDTAAGYGIVYDAQIYNYDSDISKWKELIGETRKQYPVIIGRWTQQDVTEGYSPAVVDEWRNNLFAWLDDYETYGSMVSYVADSFYPFSYINLIKDDDNWSNDDYTYPPTENWGVYVKEHLAKCVDTRYTKVVIDYGNFDDDEDSSIDASDLQIFKLHLKGVKKILNNFLPAADLDGDGSVDASDLQELKLYISKGRPFTVNKK